MKNEASNYWKFYSSEYPLNVMVIGKTICDKDYYVKRTKSRIIALEYIKKGSGILNINSDTYHTKQNSVILLTKNSCHEYYCDEDNPMDKEWIVFDGELAEYFIKTYLPENSYYFENCNLTHYFEEIERVQKNYSNEYEKMTDNISVILHRMFIHIKNSLQKSTYNLPQQIQRYLDANIEKKVTIDELSRTFCYSKNQIIKVFKDTYGMTPYHYFLERKIDIAKLYLRNTRYSINEIAQILAFADQNYFSAEFKKMTTISPSEYRKMMNHSEKI